MIQAQPQDGTAAPAAPLAASVQSALDWWRDAGIECDFVDAPVAWLAPAEEPGSSPARRPVPATVEPPAQAPAARIGGDPTAYPATLPAFRDWWLSEPSLDDGQVRERVPPRGQAGASLMVIVAQPGADDGGELLSGREGRLLAAFLAAAGLPAENVYFASALVRHTPLPDWTGLAERGLGEVLAQHIRLAAPQRLLVFGSNILPLLGHDMAQNAQTLPAFKHEDSRLPVLAARELGALLARPAWKAGLWRHWLDWTGTTTA